MNMEMTALIVTKYTSDRYYPLVMI